MTVTASASAIQAAIEAGHTNRVEIARAAGVKPWVVHYYLGPVYDAEQWEQDRQRHEAFFGGLSPTKEYQQHGEKRKGIDEW